MKTIFTILFVMLCNNIAHSEIKNNIKPVKELSEIDKLIKAVQWVESRGNSFAVNKKEQATGSLQIRPIRLKDYNQKTGANYTLDQMTVDSIAIKVFKYYAQNIGENNFEMIARRWNGSSNWSCKMAGNYWNKVQNRLKQL